MHLAIVKRSVKDLIHRKYVIRFCAEKFFITDDFEHFCNSNALPYEIWIEKIKKIIEERGVRRKKLANDFIKEVRGYL